MQKTNFSFEVVIYDDASKDKTRKIIEEYTNLYPEIFVPGHRPSQDAKVIEKMMVVGKTKLMRKPHCPQSCANRLFTCTYDSAK